MVGAGSGGGVWYSVETLGWRLSQTGEGRSDFSVAEAEGIGRLSPEKANYQCLALGLCPNLGPTGGCRKDWSLVCVCVCVCVCARARTSSYQVLVCSTLCDPMDCHLCPLDFPGKHIGVGCHFLLQGFFPTQGSTF